MNNLAVVYIEQGKYAQAEALEPLAKVFTDGTLRRRHPEIWPGWLDRRSYQLAG
jgi:hypothetical protein